MQADVVVVALLTFPSKTTKSDISYDALRQFMTSSLPSPSSRPLLDFTSSKPWKIKHVSANVMAPKWQTSMTRGLE